MAEPDMRFIGERLERVQAELRDLRSLKGEVASLKGDVAGLKLDVAQLADRIIGVGVTTSERFESLEARFAAFEARMNDRFAALEARFGASERAIDKRFNAMAEQASTSLSLVLDAVKALQPVP
ncbi:MAG: hypothetical protein P4M00_14695 [Azospirillaceae bacterium]|nr:hypothetical protein [Azospirillaceae bacterium]